VTLPTISGDEVPSAAVTKLESALGIDLPDGFGSLVVFDSKDLAAVQKAVDVASRLIVLLALLFLLLSAAAIWVSPRKRRTILQLSAAAVVVLVIERRFAIAEGNSIVGAAKAENQAAARSVVDQLLGSLLRYTGWFLVLAVVIAVVTLLSGPYPWAVRLRHFVADLGRAFGGAVRGRETSGAMAWVIAHRDALMFGIAAFGALVLLVAALSIVGILVLTALVAACEIVVYRVGTVPSDGADAPTEAAPEGR
jgi:hypothetical protein